MSPLQRAILAALADTSAHDQMSIPQLAERCRNHLQRGGAFTQITHAVEALTRCGHVHRNRTPPGTSRKRYYTLTETGRQALTARQPPTWAAAARTRNPD